MKGVDLANRKESGMLYNISELLGQIDDFSLISKYGNTSKKLM